MCLMVKSLKKIRYLPYFAIFSQNSEQCKLFQATKFCLPKVSQKFAGLEGARRDPYQSPISFQKCKMDALVQKVFF